MKVVILGAGNTSSVLCKLINRAGHTIVQVASRNVQNAAILASVYNTRSTALNDACFEEADVYIIALQDSALDHMEKFPGLTGKFVVHTAGAVKMNVLKNITENYGVMYPLQTLSKHSDRIPEIPLLIDASNENALKKLTTFADSLSTFVQPADDIKRLKYHVAAVMVSNFTNHLYALTEKFCNQEKLDWKTLFPIMDETTKRAEEISPFLSQTGPALRDDIFTLNHHLQALSTHPDLKYIYLKLSESIIKLHRKQ